MSARFAKWRAVITFADGIPSRSGLESNAHAVARFAVLCQEAGLVPIVEPEVLMTGDHTMQRCRSPLLVPSSSLLWKSGAVMQRMPKLPSKRCCIALFSHGQFGGVVAGRWIGLTVMEAQHFPLSTASLSLLSSDPHRPEVPIIQQWNTPPPSEPLSTHPADANDPQRMKQRAIQRWENEGGDSGGRRWLWKGNTVNDTKGDFILHRLGVIMEPEPGNLHEAEGVLNPAAVRGSDGQLYLFPRLVAAGNFSRIGIARVLFNDVGDPGGFERLGIALEPEADYELVPPLGEVQAGLRDARKGGFQPPRRLKSAVPCLALNSAASTPANVLQAGSRSFEQ